MVFPEKSHGFSRPPQHGESQISGAQGVLAKEVAVGELPKQGQGKDQKHTSAVFQPRFQDATKVASRSDMDDPPVITSNIFKPAVPKHL